MNTKKITVMIAAVSVLWTGTLLAEGTKKNLGAMGTEQKVIMAPFGGADDVAFAKDMWEKS